MRNIGTQQGLFEITIPASAESKTLNEVDMLIHNKDEIILTLDKEDDLTKEQLEYLKALLNLDITVFENEKINQTLVDKSIFFHAARYNLFEGLLRHLKQIDSVDPRQIDVIIGVPEREWLNIWAHTKLLAFPLIEIEMFPAVVGINDFETEITIYDSKGFTKELETLLKEEYISQGKKSEEILFRLEENRQKREIIKLIANEILRYWNITEFNDDIIYDSNAKSKTLSWAKIFKEDIDE